MNQTPLSSLLPSPSVGVPRMYVPEASLKSVPRAAGVADGQLGDTVNDVTGENLGSGGGWVGVNCGLDGDDHRGRVNVGGNLEDMAAAIL